MLFFMAVIAGCKTTEGLNFRPADSETDKGVFEIHATVRRPSITLPRNASYHRGIKRPSELLEPSGSSVLQVRQQGIWSPCQVLADTAWLNSSRARHAKGIQT